VAHTKAIPGAEKQCWCSKLPLPSELFVSEDTRMIAVITGANGFIGRHLCRRLESDGWTVRAGVRRDLQVETIANLVAGADVVIHAAGATRAPTVGDLHSSNVELTRRVATAAATAKVRRFVFVSSQAAAGPAESRQVPITEEAPSRPVEAYGRSKLEAEQVVREMSDLTHTIVRPAAVFGPGDRDFLPLFRLAKHGFAIHPANRGQWISIVHVDDAVDGIVRAAGADVPTGAIFFLANDEPMQWSELFRIAASSAGRDLTVDVEIPRTLVDFGASIGDVFARLRGKAGLLTTEKAVLSRAPFWICSNARAKRELEFAPRVSVQDGFVATYTWYRSNRWL
jgi:nucleoside-diphosphate-sugar epimerase